MDAFTIVSFRLLYSSVSLSKSPSELSFAFNFMVVCPKLSIVKFNDWILPFKFRFFISSLKAAKLSVVVFKFEAITGTSLPSNWFNRRDEISRLAVVFSI